MAKKAAPGTLIHCDTCGEDYSATYKRCPFCGEKADKYDTASRPAVKDELPEDDYIFEGGDLFDDMDDPDEGRPRRTGGKRLEQSRTPAPINWTRVITFLCGLVIIAAALVILFAYVYPNVHDPDASGSQTPAISDSPSPTPSDIVPEETPSADPGDTDTPEQPSDVPSGDVDPSADPSAPTGDNVASGIQLNKTDFTLKADESYTIKAEVSPATWSGTVTWATSDATLATVDANGTVTNVNSGKYLRSVTITATADGQTATATVYCSGGSTPAAQPSGSISGNTGTFKLNRDDFSLTLGDDDTFKMKATGVDSVTWSIEDPSIATIDASGLVTAVSKGKTIITATAPDGSTVTCIVRVRKG